MDVLLLISLGCFFALFVAALAIARHVTMASRASRREMSRRVASSDADPPLVHTLSMPLPSAEERRPTAQSLQHLALHKEPDWRFLVSRDRGGPGSGTRRPPTSENGQHRGRLDWAFFNKDFGDLSDPYQPPARKGPRTSPARSLLNLPRKEAS